jgi:hypothetical protein
VCLAILAVFSRAVLALSAFGPRAQLRDTV